MDSTESEVPLQHPGVDLTREAEELIPLWLEDVLQPPFIKRGTTTVCQSKGTVLYLTAKQCFREVLARMSSTPRSLATEDFSDYLGDFPPGNGPASTRHILSTISVCPGMTFAIQVRDWF